MTVQPDGNDSKVNMAYRGRIITVSFPTKEECVTFANALLRQYGHGDTLQLTIIIQQDKYEVSYASSVTINSWDGFLEMISEWPDES